MCSHFRCIRIGVRAEISENDEILDLAGVLEYDTGARGRLSAKDLVVGHLNKADQLRAIQIQIVHSTAALDHDQTVSSIVPDGAFYSGLNRQLFCGKQLFPVNFTVHNPAIEITFRLRVPDRHWLEVVIGFEVWIYVRIPIQLADNEVQ